MEWAEFILALGVFLGAHVVPIRLRAPLIAGFGRRAYLVGFSLLSLGLLYWLILAAGRAPFVEFWPQEPWMRWLVNLVMPLALLTVVMGGMAGLMAGLVMWSGTHFLANGDLAHVILFGLLLAYSLAGLTMALRKGATLRSDWRRVIMVLLIWGAILYLHPMVIGVSPLP